MKIESPPKSAAGIKAVLKSTELALKVMSPSKTLKVLGKLNQMEGTDCPGCAWPDPAKRSKLGEFCENGVKAIAEEAMDKDADITFFKMHSIATLREQSDYWLGQQGRLIHPMVTRKGESHYTPISWEEAFTLVAENLNELPSKDDAIFYTSGRTSNEAAFLYQLFVRIFGTNNLPDCSNMCHESSGAALGYTVGIGKGTVTLDDFYKSEVILVFGQNPGTNHPRMLLALEKAKQNGAKVVVVNPLKEVGLVNFKNPQSPTGLMGKGTTIADHYLQVKINEDVALLKVLLFKLLQKAEENPAILDHNFISQKTDGFEALKQHLNSLNCDELIKRTGVLESEIDQVVELLAANDKMIACWAMGLTQHVNAVDNIQELVNLLLIKGSIGKEGAGACPVRGHSNVQGDRTMGIWEKPSNAFLDTLATTFNFEPPREHGVDTVGAIERMSKEKGKVFFSMGGNFLSAAPDTYLTSSALENCKMTVHVSTKLNRSHLHHGDVGLILPCLGRTDKILEKSGEQKLTVENSMGLVHSTKGFMQPRSEHLLSEPHIIAQIASRTVGNAPVDWSKLIEDYDHIRDIIAKAVKGFESFNERLKTEKVIELPNGPRKQEFTNDIGKARFTVNALPNYTIEEDELMMMTIRSHDQFNTTIYGLDDRYRGVFGIRTVVFMNKHDIKKHNLDTAKTVTLFNNYKDQYREVERLTIVPYEIPEGCIATYFPECNPLIPLNETARRSNTPASKSIKVKVKQ